MFPSRLHVPVAAGLLLLAFLASPANAATLPKAGADSQGCLDCHESATPGIVGDWRASRHALTTPAEALKKPALERRVSAAAIDGARAGVPVGCAECHRARAGEPGAFEHNGTVIHTVVSPADCAGCHPEERGQYDRNVMSRAHANLAANPIFSALADEVDASFDVRDGVPAHLAPDDATRADSCRACHGTILRVTGTRVVASDQGDMVVPVLEGWPNQGVGRVNPDGSLGACTACHPRHRFAVEVARKPATCSQCHKGPDVPAYRVWEVSKHGNVYTSLHERWDFEHVPWVAGEDFGTPTCAACHASLVTAADGTVLAQRTHQYSDRLARRIFGLIYSHPQPASPDTTGLRNRAGLALPTELTGEPIAAGLIPPAEQAARTARMQKLCLGCHSTQWVDGHFARFNHAVATADGLVLAATKLVQAAWDRGLAKGLAQHASPFDEPIERLWVAQWLFWGNSVRFASAMGGADYGVFADGRWMLTRTVRDMAEWLKVHGALKR
jgi:hypothetical protein